MKLARFALALVLPATAVAAPFRTIADDEWCRDSSDGPSRRTHCEVREVTLPAAGAIRVDATPNGGIAVQAWDRGEVLLRAKVVASTEADGDPVTLAAAVTVVTDGTIHAEGPRTSGRHESGWHVSYRISVPSRTDLTLRSLNGGIEVKGVEGRIEAETTNGGIKLAELRGDVHGRTTNGGVDVRLDGTEWRGSGLDVETTNGGVTLLVPEGYNAHLETGTVNGGVRVDFPITLRGRIDRRLSTDLGRGGATIRAITTNGGVTIRRR